jgi:TolB protein
MSGPAVIGVQVDPCAIHNSLEAEAGRDNPRASFSIERVNVSSTGEQADGYSSWPSLSANGRFVSFSSDATNLVSGDTNSVSDIFVHSLVKRWTIRVSVGAGGQQGDGFSFFPAIAGNGRHVAFQSSSTNLVSRDTNGLPDIFVASFH